MIFISDITKERFTKQKLVLTIGSFDGIHLGHRKIIECVVELSKKNNCLSCVIVIRPHPRQYFSPDIPVNTLTSEKVQERILGSIGIDIIGVLPFSHIVANTEPEDFIKNVILRFADIHTIVVGHDFRFGKGAKGNFELLSNFGKSYGFEVIQIPPLIINGERVSSSLIRELVLEGEMEKIPTFLGRKYSIMGKVIRGKGIGKVLGFPTANILPFNSAIPPHGVYVAESILEDGRIFPSAINIGIAPTIRVSDFAIESYLLGFDGDLLDQTIEVVFHKRLRPEKKFSNRTELIEAIEKDVESVKSYFENIASKSKTVK